MRGKENLENYLWLISLEIRIDKENYMLSTIYHPPQVNDNLFLEAFENFLDNNINYNGTLLIIGDFNFDLSKDSFYANKCKNLIFQNGLYQIVKKHTRITQHSSTLIDYIITNDKHISHEVRLTPKISDHSILTVNINGERKGNKITKINKRSFKNYKVENFHDKLIDNNWNNRISDVNITANLFITTVKNVLESLCPKIEISIPEKYVNNKWINSDIINKMKIRDTKYEIAVITKCQEDWNSFKEIRNEITAMIRTEKEKYFNMVIEENKSNSREMWKNLKIILPGNRKLPGNTVKFSNLETSQEHIICVEFNKYFLESIKEIVTNISKYNNEYDILDKVEKHAPFPKFEKIDLPHLKKIVYSLKNTAGVEDDISTKILKDAFLVIGNRFLDVINNSIEGGIFPTEWKLSVIIPVPKVTNTIMCQEYRPINTVPPYEKALEIVVKEQLVNYCDKNSIIVPNQSGFRKNHSCETVILNICDTWLKAIDNGDIVVAVFLDFRRAFETIDRCLLLKKLEKMGICDTALKWFQSYLSHRTQKVKYNNCTSPAMVTKYGVPQGTVLGPILFILYINDMIKCVDKCQIKMFADDTMLYIKGKNIVNLIHTINHELKIIFEWLCDNSLCINVNKCKYMIIASKHKLNNVDDNHIVKINDINLDRVKEMKYLGVIIDENLNLKKHANYIMNKMSKKVSFLYRIGNSLSMFTKILIYKAIIAPHIDFCSSILFNLNQNQIQQLQKIQNRAMRIILKCNRYTPIRTMLDVLNLMNINQRIVYRTLIIIYKIKNKMLPSYLFNEMKYVNDIHDYSTRNANNFFIDTFNRASTEKSVLSKGLKLYNNLPVPIKNSQNLNSFKKMLSNYVVKSF